MFHNFTSWYANAPKARLLVMFVSPVTFVMTVIFVMLVMFVMFRYRVTVSTPEPPHGGPAVAQ